ncbi:hypothetical protein G5V57_26365 [Nordella sp. HKS 07]|uniref:hypothetical protein n=1 Tax=Nordella sp. HKS 07 TaxID=2712222 RepID=UPI0013E12555|nr:hypothetical protein [Nordella sp. HKS 07]QIG50944.1 hypothetical protein G5V57_26365 [Nordella sp. HKS 07]
MNKLKDQITKHGTRVQHLAAEMLWALLLFPSDVKAGAKRQNIGDIWALSGDVLDDTQVYLADGVLAGIGAAGPGFNNYRADEFVFLIELTRDLKGRPLAARRAIFGDYDAFTEWIGAVPQKGFRQFRHMIRYFAFPETVERISSNSVRRRILEAFDAAPAHDTRKWTDRHLDEALLNLRRRLEHGHPGQVLDFYEPPLKERWQSSGKVKTPHGEVTVAVPDNEDVGEGKGDVRAKDDVPETRRSFRYQALLAEIGAMMGFSIGLPANDRTRVKALMVSHLQDAISENLPLSYDSVTMQTVSQIDVIWLKQRYMVRAFEVEHTTAVYSGLLRMADLLALQPNMNIKLHIVASEERRTKVFNEILRPVFSLLGGAPLSERCTFLSYESVTAIRSTDHLAHTNDSVIQEFEERAEAG